MRTSVAETKRARGRYFEEMAVGHVVESPGRTITETDIVFFAGISGNYNPLHTDAEYAKTTIFGERVAHGLLGLSVAGGLAWRTGLLEGTADALVGVDWKFRAPILVGDTIRLQAQISQKKEMRRLGGGFVIFSVILLNQRDQVVQKGAWTLLIRSRPAAEEE